MPKRTRATPPKIPSRSAMPRLTSGPRSFDRRYTGTIGSFGSGLRVRTRDAAPDIPRITAQAKRIFGFIGGGASLGGIAGSSLTIFATKVGTSNLLLVSASIMALCAVLVVAILRIEKPDLRVSLAGAGAIHAAGVIPSMFLGSLPTSQAVKQNVAKAKSEVAASGISNPTIDLEYPSDITSNGLSFGVLAQKVKSDLGKVGITVNRNAIPFDPRPPMNPSGLRIGTPALTTRGLVEEDMTEIAAVIATALSADCDAEKDALADRTRALMDRYPLYPQLSPAAV